MNRETEILQLVNEFPLLSNKEIGKKLGINKSTITYYLHKNNSSYYLHTEGFIIEDINYLKNLLFTKYNIETVIHTNRGKNLLYVKAKSKKLFTTIIYPYICNSMKYKLFDLSIGSE